MHVYFSIQKKELYLYLPFGHTEKKHIQGLRSNKMIFTTSSKIFLMTLAFFFCKCMVMKNKITSNLVPLLLFGLRHGTYIYHCFYTISSKVSNVKKAEDALVFL